MLFCLSLKCVRGARPRASIQQLVTPGPNLPPPTHIRTRTGRSAKRQLPPAKIAHSRQRLKEASTEPKHDLFRATWPRPILLLLSQDAKDTETYLSQHVALFFVADDKTMWKG